MTIFFYQLLKRDEYWMRLALVQATLAAQQGEVPVGAVLVVNCNSLTAYNNPITLHDPTAHAEIIALRRGARFCHNYRMPGAELYVTTEPCVMCLGAILQARITRVVFGCLSYRDGAVVSHPLTLTHNNWLHHLQYLGGVLQTECSAVLKRFFQHRRKRLKKTW